MTSSTLLLRRASLTFLHSPSPFYISLLLHDQDSKMSELNIFLTTWNTGLQGSKAQSQDLTSWLLPVLQGSSQNPAIPRGDIPDIYAIGIQELLPLHLACKLHIPVLAPVNIS